MQPQVSPSPPRARLPYSTYMYARFVWEGYITAHEAYGTYVLHKRARGFGPMSATAAVVRLSVGPPATAAPSTPSAKKAAIPSDERKQVAALFKDFCGPGTSKASLSEVPALLKELAKGMGAAGPQVKKLVSFGKEALAAKCGGGQVGSADFINWYFEVAWEELKSAANAERTERKRPDKKPVANKSTGAERNRQAAGVDAGGTGGGGTSGIIGGDCVAFAAAAAPARPYGWELAQGVNVDEYRRLLQLCCQFQRPTGARGLVPASQLQPLLRAALADDTQLLHEVLTALPTPERQSDDEEPVLPIGVLIKFWFDYVFPRASRRLKSEQGASPRT